MRGLATLKIYFSIDEFRHALNLLWIYLFLVHPIWMIKIVSNHHSNNYEHFLRKNLMGTIQFREHEIHDIACLVQ
jgi:hypothetical protein